VAPFGLIAGVAMVAGGIPPLAAMAMSLVVYAGASMLAATQLLAANTPLAVILLTVFFINLRFMMYSVSLRPHLGKLPLRWKLAAGYLLADNAFGLSIARFTERAARLHRAHRPAAARPRHGGGRACCRDHGDRRLGAADAAQPGAGRHGGNRGGHAGAQEGMTVWISILGMGAITLAPELLLQKGVLYLSLHNDRLLAGAVAIVAAWRWRLTFATIASGLIALHFFDWLL
jgi:hypothetical protein